MKEFFPNNAVEYFVSYYDYYQPEAYVPSTDTYIEKDSAINDEIDKLRHSATAALSERNDVIIVASVSCIYGLGSPIDYKNMVISLRPGMEKDRDEVIHKLIDIQYTRNEMDFKRGSFRVRGDVLEVFPAYSGSEAYTVAALVRNPRDGGNSSRSRSRIQSPSSSPRQSLSAQRSSVPPEAYPHF